MPEGILKEHASRGFGGWLRRVPRRGYRRLPRNARFAILFLVITGATILAISLVGFLLFDFAVSDDEGITDGRHDLTGARATSEYSPFGGGAWVGAGGRRIELQAGWEGGKENGEPDIAVARPDIAEDPFLLETLRVRRFSPNYNTIHAVTVEMQKTLRYRDRGFYERVHVHKGGEHGERVPSAFRQVADYQLAATLRWLSADSTASAVTAASLCSHTQKELGVCLLSSAPPLQPSSPLALSGGGADVGPDDIFNDPLPGLRTAWRTHTPAQLLSRYGHMDFLYSFVNGTEANHVYRRLLLRDDACAHALRELALFAWEEGERAPPKKDQPWLPPMTCVRSLVSQFPTGAALLVGLAQQALRGTSDRDRETDELRHSLRSVEEYVRWHRGRVLMVSPGHHPLWVDNAKNFLSGSCGGVFVSTQRERGTHLRLTTVHQDAIMPYGLKLTLNSHIIEQHLWRVQNASAVHVYLNDDYFVNRDVAITDLLNEHGGTIIRTESAVIKGAAVADTGESWAQGVLHNNLFNVLELDIKREDYLPASLVNLWDRTLLTTPVHQVSGQLTGGIDRDTVMQALALRAETNDYVVEIARTCDAETLIPLSETPLGDMRKRRRRFYATHAPFVYCTNMFRHLSVRYEREFAHNALTHSARRARDFFIPFLYNAFVMARPWQASPKFLPYVLNKRHAVATEQGTTIYLNNEDGCAPATLYADAADAHIVYTQLKNDLKANSAAFARIDVAKPIFFNINAGFTSQEAAEQLSSFLRMRFPTPIYLERGFAPVSEEDRALPQLYGDLMKLPVIAVTSFEEGVCPMVRSLQLALPDHTGYVVTAVARHGTDKESDPTLAELRSSVGHRIRSGLPCVACSWNRRVRPLQAVMPVPSSVEAAGGGEALLNHVLAALAELKEAPAMGASHSTVAVTMPSVCGIVGGSGDGGEVRVRAMVLDGRAEQLPVLSRQRIRHAVTMPGQTLALEDFDVVWLNAADEGNRVDVNDVVLVLSRSAAEAKAVHWIDGASENDLLLTYPIPHTQYEELDTPLRFVEL